MLNPHCLLCLVFTHFCIQLQKYVFYKAPWYFYKPLGPAACARCQDNWATTWCNIFCKCKILSRLKSFTTVAPFWYVKYFHHIGLFSMRRIPGPREESKCFGNFSQIWWHWASSPTLRISLSAVNHITIKVQKCNQASTSSSNLRKHMRRKHINVVD